MESEESMCALAWWDPKNRKFYFDWSTLEPGVLLATKEEICFVTPDSVVFTARGPDARVVAWDRMRQAADVCCGGRTYRLLFAPDGDGVRTLSESQLERTMGTAVETVELGSVAIKSVFESFAGIADVFEIGSKTVRLITSTIKWKHGHDNFKRFRTMFDASAS